MYRGNYFFYIMFLKYLHASIPLYISFKIDPYKYKVISLCFFFGCLIINLKPSDQFASNFVWETRKNQEIFLSQVNNSKLIWLTFMKESLVSRQSWVPKLVYTYNQVGMYAGWKSRNEEQNQEQVKIFRSKTI